MRLNAKQSLFESFQNNLKESYDKEIKLNEYGDTKDYSEDIQKVFKKWFKENADLGIRAIQAVTDSYYLDIDVEESGEKETRKKVYTVKNSSPLVDVQDYADEIGSYISDNIPSIKYNGNTYDEDELEVTWTFTQQIGMPDFGEKIFDSAKVNLKEVYKQSRQRLNETTNKGIQAKQDDLYGRIRQALKDAGEEKWENIVGYKTRLPKDIADAFDKEEEELSCIRMIHSILTYSNERNIDKLIENKYLKDYIDSLGEEKVREILAGEIEEYSKATINKDVYTDSEGLTYNSVKFSDD